MAKRFADPYKLCVTCGAWVTGYKPVAVGRDILLDCGHSRGYIDVCPSWGPVDGCECERVFGRLGHAVPPGPFPAGVTP